MTDIDRIVVEATKTHRKRLIGAFVFGGLTRRRAFQDNRARLIGSSIVAAVACSACFGTAFVLNILSDQREDKALAAFRAALATNPIPSSEAMPQDEATGFLEDPNSDDLIDPQTGYIVDRETGLATDEQGRLIDPRIDWYFDPDTGYYTDPESGVTIDPETLQVVRD